MEYPPYVDTTEKIGDFFSEIKKASVPPKFTLDFLNTVLGLNSSSHRDMISLLKKLDFLTQDSVPTQFYKDYRDDNQSEFVLAEQITKAYSELYQVSEYAHKLSREELTNKLRTLLGASNDDKNISKVTSTFTELVKLSNFDKHKKRKHSENKEEPQKKETLPTNQEIPKDQTDWSNIKRFGITIVTGVLVFVFFLYLIIEILPKINFPSIEWRQIKIFFLLIIPILLITRVRSYRGLVIKNIILRVFVLSITLLSFWCLLALLCYGEDENLYKNKKLSDLLHEYKICKQVEIGREKQIQENILELKNKKSKSRLSAKDLQEINIRLKKLQEEIYLIRQGCELKKTELKKYIMNEKYFAFNDENIYGLRFAGIDPKAIVIEPSDIISQVVNGKISCFMPDSMKIKQNYIVRAGISKSLKKNIIVSIPKQSGQIIIDTIEVSSAMRVSIIDPNTDEEKNFSITPISTTEQLVDTSNVTYWEWYIMPLKTGNLPIIIRATYRIIDQSGNNYRDIEAYKRTVYVYSDTAYSLKSFFYKNWQFLITSILSILAISYVVKPIRDYMKNTIFNIYSFFAKKYLSIINFFKHFKSTPKKPQV